MRIGNDAFPVRFSIMGMSAYTPMAFPCFADKGDLAGGHAGKRGDTLEHIIE